MFRRGRLIIVVLAIWGMINFVVMEWNGTIRDWFHRPAALRPGFQLREHRTKSGDDYRYSLFVPYGNSPDQRPPVILYLNGIGKNGDDGLMPLRDGLAPVVWESKATFPCVVIFPQSQWGGSWQPGSIDTEHALEVLEWVQQELNTDRDRVYVTGLSYGGTGTWMIGSDQPDRFAALAPMSGHWSLSPTVRESICRSHLPVWSFCCEKDQYAGLVQANQDVHRDLISAGGESRLTVIREGDHNSWDYAYRSAGFWNWLLSQSRSRNSQSKLSFAPLLQTSLDDWTVHGPANWKRGDQPGLIRATSEVPATGWLESGFQPAHFALHLEFQLETADFCGILLHGKFAGTQVEGLLCEIRLSDDGSGGIVDARTGTVLVPADPVGARALKREEWNDLRIEVSDDNVRIFLNGATLVDQASPDFRGSGSVALRAPLNGAINFRHLRIATGPDSVHLARAIGPGIEIIEDDKEIGGWKPPLR